MHLSRDVILLLTHSEDYFTIDRVAAALSRRGARPFRLDTDLFPTTVRLAASLSNEETSYRLSYGEESIVTEQVRSVWMRRLWQPRLSQKLAPFFQAACIRESMTALNNFLGGLRNARWVDRLSLIDRAENKLQQLIVAKEIGLRIPRTLMTNNPDEVREFFQAVRGNMVAKLLTPLSAGMQGSAFFLYTSKVEPEDLLAADALRYSPMVFQEQIPKQRELRAVFVAGKLFVGVLNASRYAATNMDWRNAAPEACQWERGELPSEITRRLCSLMATFGLTFGAFDLIQTPDNEYVFLEVNPTGEWGMLERDLGYPIADAIADALLTESK
ncbi:MAG: MvdC family ATP-grasp ribosomal peptide maturase [Hydrococcus sp. RM1_1_31]|nr:MvdC family ATP-grasp ribosomal peptide maturase [Hydrococcus sp. RM1_1_31]